MTPRRAQLLTAVLAAIFLMAAIILFFALGHEHGPLRWALSIPLLVMGLALGAFVPRFSREELPAEDSFRPLGPEGRPVVGSAIVQNIALVLSRELYATPHQIETAPHAVRVSYDTGGITSPAGRSTIRFGWRTTLAPTSSPTTFLRLDQQFTSRQGLGWGRASVHGGLAWMAAGKVSVAADGTVTKTGVSTTPMSQAIKKALAESGARQAASTMELVGITAGALGVLVAIGAVVGAVLL